MDTHIADRPEIQVTDADEALPHPLNNPAATDRLGGFRPLREPDRLSPAPQPVRKRRNALMITACGVAVLAVAGGVFWISPYNHYHLADAGRLAGRARDMAMSTLPGTAAPGPIAPAARLARAPEPTRTPLPQRPPVTFSPAASQGDDMAEFLKLGGQTPPPGAPARAPMVVVAPTASSPPPPVTSVPPPASPAPARVVLAAKPQVAQPAAVPETARASQPGSEPAAAPVHPPLPQAPADPVAKIAALQAAPMTDTQQLQVLELVTQLGVLVRDQRVEIAQLRTDQQNLTQRVNLSITDFGRRISLAEARGAVNAAMGTGVVPPQTSTPAGAAGANTGVAQVVSKAVAPATPPTADSSAHRYHVQAASPGLAMLSELDASGGEERQLPVAPGEDVPGWGKVVSIVQQGTSWVVKTDHGVIQ